MLYEVDAQYRLAGYDKVPMNNHLKDADYMLDRKEEIERINDIIAMEKALPRSAALLDCMWERFGKPSPAYLARYCRLHKKDRLVTDMVVYLWYLGWDFEISEFCPEDSYSVLAHRYIFEESDYCRNFDLALKLLRYCLVKFRYGDMNAISLLAFMLKYGIGLSSDCRAASDWLEIVKCSNADSEKTRSVAFVYFEGRLAYEGLDGIAVRDEAKGRKLLAAARRNNLDESFFCVADYFDQINGYNITQNRRLSKGAHLFNGGICESTMFIEDEVSLLRNSYIVHGQNEDIGLSCALARYYSGMEDERTLKILLTEVGCDFPHETCGEMKFGIKDLLMYCIGWLYLFGEDKICNHEKALQYLTEAGNANNKSALRLLVGCYDRGLFGKRKGTAVKWISKLVAEGDAFGLWMKGKYYFEGYYPSEHRLNNAILCYGLAARKGDAESMRCLAEGFLFGAGGWPLDIEKGIYWLMMCLQAKEEIPFMNTVMGVCLCVGRGLCADERKGRMCFEKARDGGDAVAHYILSGRYALQRAVMSTLEWLEGKYSSYDENHRERLYACN